MMKLHSSILAWAILLLLAAFTLTSSSSSVAQSKPSPSEAPAPSASVVVFAENGFPGADSATASRAQLEKWLPRAQFVSADQLPAALGKDTTRLLVLPYGSAFPEVAWPEIRAYLQGGGNLLVLGGRPFTSAAYRDGTDWHLRDYSVRFTRQLLIDQYQETPGSDGLEFEANPDLLLRVPKFTWKRGFSPIIHLTAMDLYKREGSAGSLDARLDTIAWGAKEGRHMSAPVLEIDHLRNRFSGGRWIFLNAELTSDFYGTAEAQKVIAALAEAAQRGSEEFIVRPTLPLYLPGEPIGLEVSWLGTTPAGTPLTAKITESSEQPGSGSTKTVSLPLSEPLFLPAPSSKGLHTIEAELMEGSRVRAVYRSGFWIRDEAYLRSGPRLTVNRDYFELDGHPLAVVGTTYMASDVQRLFFEHPNVHVWDRDLEQISSAGLNMLRTGWWTGWNKFCDENGQPYERTLRTLEAYLMTARRHGLPVQFNFFAFLPDALGGANAYLDPEAVHRQQKLISSVAARFHNVPFLAWDLINEPSFSQYLWKTRPNEDPIELDKWNQWLNRRYPDRATLAHAWNLPSTAAGETLPVPTQAEFDAGSVYSGQNSLKLYDYYLFAEQSFADWVQGMRAAIRATGAQQPITVGQDEGGYLDRLSPAFFGPFVDFTTNHTWWQNDSLLWDSLVAKQPGLPMLIQETGLQREVTLDEIARRTPESEAALLERKIALSFVSGAGAIEWLWNSNVFMTEDNEVPIGALRADATEKPEATLLRDFAKFAKVAGEHFRNPQQPQVAIVTSQAAQFSVLNEAQVGAQRKAVLAAAYYSRVPVYVTAENQIAKLGSPKLAILPSPQSLNEETWNALLKYVSEGGNLLITGPVERDQHWRRIQRAAKLGIDAQAEPLTYRNAEIRVKDRTIPLTFDQQAQGSLESLRFSDGATLKQVARGKGRIFWAAYPAELAQGLDSAAELYSYVLGELGITAPFESAAKISPGVLLYPTVLEDSVLYVMVSDSADHADLDFRDKLTGARLKLQLPSQHAALAVIRKSDGAVVAKYGF